MHQFLLSLGIFLNFFIFMILIHERITQINSNNSPFGNEMNGVIWSTNMTHTIPDSRRSFNTSINCLKDICEELSYYKVNSVTILVRNQVGNCNSTFSDGITYLYEHDPIKMTLVIFSLISLTIFSLILGSICNKYHNKIFVITFIIYLITILTIMIYGLVIIGQGPARRGIISNDQYEEIYLIFIMASHLLLSLGLIIKIIIIIKEIFDKYNNSVQLDFPYIEVK